MYPVLLSKVIFYARCTDISKSQVILPRSQAGTTQTGSLLGLCCPTATARIARWACRTQTATAQPTLAIEKQPEDAFFLSLPQPPTQLNLANSLSLQEEPLQPAETLCKDQDEWLNLIKGSLELAAVLTRVTLWTPGKSVPTLKALLRCFLQPKHHLRGSRAQSEQQRTVRKGLGWAGVTKSDRAAAMQASKAQKLRLSRASES